MSQYIPFLVIGITVGTVYGLAAMGLVLTYKTTGVFNFGHGAIGAGAAVVFYQLRQRNHLNAWLAGLIAIVVFGIVIGFLIEGVARRLALVSTTYKIVATVGIIVFTTALVQLIYGVVNQNFDPVLSQSTAFTISGVEVPWEKVIVTLFGIVSAVGLYVFFQRTQTGRSMRAVVDDPQLLDMAGISPARVRRTAWIIGCCFAAVSGVLLASTQEQLDVTLLSLLIVQALGAAAIGRFTNLPLSFAGGIIVGIVQAIVSKQSATHTSLQGLDTNTPFIILFLLLLLTPRGKLVELGAAVRSGRGGRRNLLPPRYRNGLGAAVLVGALTVPAWAGVHQATWSVAMSETLLFLSLGLLVRTSGQISLCQIGFFAVGAAAFGHLLGNGVPWLFAVLIAGLIVVPIGFLIAIPAIRLSGLYLGLATLGFGVLLANYFYGRSYFFGSRVGLQTTRPAGFTGDTQYYYLLLIFAAAGIGLVLFIERARLGRLLRGLADSPLALSTLGVSSNVTLVIVFCLSAFLAGISGAVNASVFGGITQDSYSYFVSLVILAVLAFSGTSTVVAAIVAPLLYVVVPAYINDADAALWLQLVFGIAAILTALLVDGQAGRLFGRLTASSDESAAPNRLSRRHEAPVRTVSISQSRAIQEVSAHV